MRVLGYPLLAHSLSPQHHRRPSRAVKSLAVFGVAGGLEHRHSDCRESVARHDATQIVQVPAKAVNMAPDVTPLLLFGGFASNSERCEGAEGNHIVGKERAGADKIHRLNADLEGSEPPPD